MADADQKKRSAGRVCQCISAQYRSQKIEEDSQWQSPCDIVRQGHVFADSFVRFPSDEENEISGENEYEVWCQKLGREVEEVRKMKDPRMFVGHFCKADIVFAATEQTCRFLRIWDGDENHVGKTRVQGRGTTETNWHAPPRPVATNSEMTDSSLYTSPRNRKRGKRVGSITAPASINRVLKDPTRPVHNQSPMAKMQPLATPTKQEDALPKRPGPQHPGMNSAKYFITSFNQLIECLAKPVIAHCNSGCGGTIGFKSERCTMHGLAGRMVLTCSVGEACECAAWLGGVWKFLSDETMSIPCSDNTESGSREEAVANVKYAIAQSMCAIQRSQGEVFLTAMQLQPRSRAVLESMIKDLVRPYIHREKKRKEGELNDELIDMEALAASIDVGYNGSRNAQNATCSYAVGGKIRATMTDTDRARPAIRKEPHLFNRMLVEHIITKMQDISQVLIDQNASNECKTNEFKRQNASNPLLRMQAVTVSNDTYHAAAAMPNKQKTFLFGILFSHTANSIYIFILPHDFVARL